MKEDNEWIREQEKPETLMRQEYQETVWETTMPKRGDSKGGC